MTATSSLSAYNFDLPKELIAYYPKERGTERLLVLEKGTGRIEDAVFEDIVNRFDEEWCIVFNNSRVIPRRLIGHKKGSKAKIDCLFVESIDRDKRLWRVLLKPKKKIKPKDEILFLEGKLMGVYKGENILEFHEPLSDAFFDENGLMPLPPYIKRLPEEKDKQAYQTVYAKVPGSIAAPTAGLHFNEKILEGLKSRGVDLYYLTLHVGIGTFRPVKDEDITRHKMHTERLLIPKETASALQREKKSGKKFLAVGTTSARALEAAADILAGEEIDNDIEIETDIFIYPPYKFKAVDGLLTNFHLPKSTLLMLVCAFGGYNNIMDAYKYAVDNGYTFFSYGDAMLIV